MSELSYLYDQRYKRGYLVDFTDLAEADRMISLKNSLRRRVVPLSPRRILDYGCGQGRYLPVWQSIFPQSELYGADISPEAIRLILGKYPEMESRFSLISRNKVLTFKDEYFDLILSIEVMEHVENIFDYLADIYRLLVPGGIFVWTTPCGNRYSLEWIWGILSNGILPTEEGFRRFRWEDSAHIRRLTSGEISLLLEKIGHKPINFDFRTHFFGTLAYQVWLRIPYRAKFTKIFTPFAHLDYLLFRRLPNASSMIGIAKKKINTSL